MSSVETKRMIMTYLDMDYVSRSIMSRKLGTKIPDAALKDLMDGGLIEGIAVSGQEPDHFRLTEAGKRFIKKKGGGS